MPSRQPTTSRVVPGVLETIAAGCSARLRGPGNHRTIALRSSSTGLSPVLALPVRDAGSYKEATVAVRAGGSEVRCVKHKSADEAEGPDTRTTATAARVPTAVKGA
eukprot:scaffold7714_cov390-Prasinococcus_capsulatus_cf.AAC.2